MKVEDQLFISASVAAKAGINIPLGTAPTSPLAGDLYPTSGPHLYFYDGVTAHDLLSAGSGVTSITNSDGTLTISPTTGAAVASLALGHSNTWTAEQLFPAATTSHPSINLASSAGTDVTSPTSGDLWWNGTNLYFRSGAANIDLLAPPSSGTGFSAAVVGATGSITSSPSTQTFGALVFDSTGTQAGPGNNSLICRSTGYYLIVFTIVVPATTYLATAIEVNGGAPPGLGGFPSGWQMQWPVVSGFDSTGVSTLITHLNSGDSVTAVAWTASGGGSVAGSQLMFAKL